MATIFDIQKKYGEKIDRLDLELIIAHAAGKTREFVLSHPEEKIPKNQERTINNFVRRRIKDEPLAYILGKKEFYGLDFKVNKNTLIPRPETEMIVEKVLHSMEHGTPKKNEFPTGQAWNNKSKLIIADIGTGSGNIIISLSHNIKNGIWNNLSLYGIDSAKKALRVAKLNAKINKVDKKIIFLHGNLLKPIIKKRSMFHVPCSMIITANLPYLSPKIYASAPKSVRNYEPKTALISQKEGLAHYEKLLEQMKFLKQNYSMPRISCFMEISPEQKNKIYKTVKKYFSKAKIIFHKDLSGRWRICEAVISNYKF